MDSMPPYIAVSHAWADGLFNSGLLFRRLLAVKPYGARSTTL